jgi:hypothetical protein
VRLSPEEKERLQAVAANHGLTESALLKRTIDRIVDPSGLLSNAAADSPAQGVRLNRLVICLHPDIRGEVAERAKARGLPVATYIAALVRSHVRHLSPLTKIELREFEKGVVQLHLIGRNLNQLTRRANAERLTAIPRREDLALFLKTCTAMVGHLEAMLVANKKAWELGHE